MSAAWGPVPRFFLVPFLLFWSFVTLLFDGVMGYRVARQFLTARYSSVPGTITRSEVTESPSTEGSTYRFEVRYTYEVNGREYMGTDASHSLADGYASSREPRTLARRFPVGVTVPVFYRPEAPEVSVLLKGTQASDLFFLMFMTPFNSVMLAGWYSVTKPLWRRTRRPDNPVGATFKEGRTHVPLTGTRSKIVIWLPGEQLNTLFKKDRRHALLAELSPVGAGLWAVASTSIVGCFVAMVPMEFELVPPMPLMMLVWSTVIATGLSV
ncbi:MAG TPA: DUF3592 domain-containing protein, partial [Myxococcaceae bacterium]|nr:DUF3592 domain-containing protein [Myxococcaceae bacterium]